MWTRLKIWFVLWGNQLAYLMFAEHAVQEPTALRPIMGPSEERIKMAEFVCDSPGRYVLAAIFAPGTPGAIRVNGEDRVTSFSTSQHDVQALEYLLPGDTVFVKEGELAARKLEYIA